MFDPTYLLSSCFYLGNLQRKSCENYDINVGQYLLLNINYDGWEALVKQCANKTQGVVILGTSLQIGCWCSGGTISKIFRKGDDLRLSYNNLQKQETRKVIYHDNLQKRPKEQWAVKTICKKDRETNTKQKKTCECANTETKQEEENTRVYKE